ncbi:MAG TPA: VWA domain-containing protein [Candidatus Acidoferrales bacterium]|nr:VWA domain-containing protein [Candidatus Acidoferrales bacterium]
MARSLIRWSIFSAAFVLAAAALAAPQSPPPPEPAPQKPAQGVNPPPLRVQANLVNIIATVVTRREKLVTDLDRSEFHVFEDGKEQKIQFFSRETDLPLRIGLLLDTSNSIRERLEFEKDAAIDFLHNTLRRGKDQAFLMIFDNEPSVIQNYTEDAGVLTEAVQRQRAGGGTALYDAIIRASGMLADAPQPADHSAVRRIIVVISDGDDNLSNASRGAAIEAAERAGASIYCISSSTQWVSAADLSDPHKRVDRKYLMEEPDKVLVEFASQTGGRAFFPYSVDDLGQSFQDIGEELRNQYSLAYIPPAAPADGRFRKITVDVGRKGLVVRTRKGYYATPPDSPAAPSSGHNE